MLRWLHLSLSRYGLPRRATVEGDQTVRLTAHTEHHLKVTLGGDRAIGVGPGRMEMIGAEVVDSPQFFKCRRFHC